MSQSISEPASVAARAGALDLVITVVTEKRSLSEVLASPPVRFGALPPEARARAQRLALAGFRQMGRADAHLKRALRKTPPEPVLWLLRLALIEMHALGAPAHGVINDAVALTRARGFARLSGLVNAVLRQLAEGVDWAAGPAPRLPDWLRGRLQNAYGAQVTASIEAAHLRPPPLDLTLKGARPEGLAGALLPTGSLRLDAPGQITQLPGYAEGAFWVQDAASALPVQLLGNVAGLRVLDLCAAPGGKTMQLAARGARVTALDLSASRLQRLHENLTRTGLAADVIVADALDWQPTQAFDAIVLDAPCSATGTIRRHPELPLIRSGADIKALRDLQAKLLDRVLDPAQGLLTADGRVVYCTCSLLPSEGEDQLAGALARHGARVLPATLPGLPSEAFLPCGGVRTRPDFWPETGGMDGFFMAVIAPASAP